MAGDSKSHDVKGFLQTAFSRVSAAGGRRDPQERRAQGAAAAARDRPRTGTWPTKLHTGDPGDQDHGAADQLPLPHRRRAHAAGAGLLPLGDRDRGAGRRGRPARPRPGREEEGGKKKAKAQGRAPPPSRPRPTAEEGVEKIKGHNYFIATVTRPPRVYRGNPFQVEVGLAYGGSWPADKPIELFRFANRVPLLFQRGACGITEAVVQDRLAQLPAQPAQGLAAGRAHGAARAHRLGLGAVHQRVEGGGGPLPGDHPGDPARRPGVRPQAGRPHPQEAARRLPGPAPLHLRALHRGGGRRPSARSWGAAPTPSAATSCGWPRRSPRPTSPRRTRSSRRRPRRRRQAAAARAEEDGVAMARMDAVSKKTVGEDREAGRVRCSRR